MTDNKIRQLKGQDALRHKEFLQSLEYWPKIGPIVYLMFEIRRRIAIFLDLKLNYFYERHLYSPQDRRLLDNFYIAVTTEGINDGIVSSINIIRIIRFKYLSYLHRKELKFVHEWIRVTSSKEDPPVFVWHEDIEKYNANVNDLR